MWKRILRSKQTKTHNVSHVLIIIQLEIMKQKEARNFGNEVHSNVIYEEPLILNLGGWPICTCTIFVQTKGKLLPASLSIGLLSNPGIHEVCNCCKKAINSEDFCAWIWLGWVLLGLSWASQYSSQPPAAAPRCGGPQLKQQQTLYEAAEANLLTRCLNTLFSS